MESGFLSWYWISLLLALPGLIWFVKARLSIRATRAARLSLSVKSSTTALPIIAVVYSICVIALMRPFWGKESITVPAVGIDRVIVMDISASMLAKDISPSRMELAKRKAAEYVKRIEESGRSDRIGLVLFAGGAYLYCPLTDDYGVFGQFLSFVSPSLVSSLGSNLASGISTAFEALDRIHSTHSRILLISDGEASAQTVGKVLEARGNREVPIDVLGVGTLEGAPIQMPGSSGNLKDANGNIVISKLAEDELEIIATKTSGSYARAELLDRDLDSILSHESEPLVVTGSNGNTTITTYNEFGALLMVLPIILIFILTHRRFGAGLLSLVLFLAVSDIASADDSLRASPTGSARSAWEAYQAGDYKSAKSAYQSALEAEPNNRDIIRGLASSNFRLNEFNDAAKSFEKLGETDSDPREAFSDHYNAGTAFLKAEDFESSIKELEKALQIKPDDIQAQKNLEIAKELLKRRQSIPTPTTPPTPTPQETAQPTPSPEGGATPTPKSTSPSGETATPTSAPSSQPTAGGTESASPSPAATKGTPQGSPSPGGTSTTSPNERPKEAEHEPTEAPPTPYPAATSNFRPTPQSARPTVEPKQREASSWVDSLPDAPLLVRRKKTEDPPEGQTW